MADARTGGHDQAVIGDLHAVAGKHAAQRRRDLALGEDAGRHLVEQRLEQVVVGAVDERDLDRRALQRLGRVEPAEATADDDDAMGSVIRVGMSSHGTGFYGRPLRDP